MNNIFSIKINTLFLAVVLITGTITAIYPSFIIIGVQAQGDPYYQMDNRYNSYEPEYSKYPDKKYNNYQQEYPPEYADREYNSYGPDYEMEIYEKKSYRDDNYYELAYPSYKSDYKPDYSSYIKDKLKKDSISINKLNCINNNVNINGNNTGDINVGNSGKSAIGSGTDEGYLGVGSSGGNYGEGYDNGYNKQKGESFTCVINNNNNNTNIVAGGGNATDGGNGDVTGTCEGCFLEALGPANFAKLLNFLAGPTPKAFDSLEQFCTFLQIVIADSPLETITNDINVFLTSAGISLTNAELAALVACLYDVLGGGTDNNTAGGLVPFNTNIDTSTDFGKAIYNNAGGLASSFSSPTIAQGTEEDLSALEKITKLKQQWLSLLP